MGTPDFDHAKILIIDDDDQIRGLLVELLCRDHHCSQAASAEEALAALNRQSFDLILSDVKMGGMSGLELIPHVFKRTPDTVVIMISGEQTIETAIEAMRAGAFDYIMKPVDVRHVEAAVDRALNHNRLLKERRRYKKQLEALLRQRTAEVNRLAYYDLPTELPNRALLEDRLGQALVAAEPTGRLVGVLFVGLDQFKKVNDTMGHARGDSLLKDVAARLRSCVSDNDTVARFGGDEFAVVLTEVMGTEDVIETIGLIVDTLKAPFNIGNDELLATASVGVSLFPFDGEDSHTLLQNAGAALYKAKTMGGNNYQFFTADMHAIASKRLALETSLRRAIENEEFLVYYQPKICVASLKITGVEALVRWQHPQLGLVGPKEFIGMAEDTGLIVPLGEWVLKSACRQNKIWQDCGYAPMRVSVNLSARQFQQRNVAETVIRTLERTGLAPEHLELELTESSIMSNPESAIDVLSGLKSMGIKISVDDFGTGFSSLSHLKRLPIDCLKVDQSFVRDATTDANDAALVTAIITLAHNLKMSVVAEGVETEEQLHFLHKLRCDEIQGYLFSRPLTAAGLVDFLTLNKPLSFPMSTPVLQV